MAKMPTEIDSLMRPVLRGVCDYSEIDGTRLDYFAFWEMNEALDAEDENRSRIEKFMTEKNKRGH